MEDSIGIVIFAAIVGIPWVGALSLRGTGRQEHTARAARDDRGYVATRV